MSSTRTGAFFPSMALQRILDKHKDFLEASNEDRVVCRLTGHSIPARSDAVSAYVK